MPDCTAGSGGHGPGPLRRRGPSQRRSGGPFRAQVLVSRQVCRSLSRFLSPCHHTSPRQKTGENLKRFGHAALAGQAQEAIKTRVNPAFSHPQHPTPTANNTQKVTPALKFVATGSDNPSNREQKPCPRKQTPPAQWMRQRVGRPAWAGTGYRQQYRAFGLSLHKELSPWHSSSTPTSRRSTHSAS